MSTLSLETWLAFSPVQQILSWLAVPDLRRAEYIAAASPSARCVFEYLPDAGQGIAADRANIYTKLQLAGHWYGIHNEDLREQCEKRGLIDTLINTTQWEKSSAQNWANGLDPTLVEGWPAYKLVARMGKMVPGTRERWEAAGGKLYRRQMAALKTDPVWVRFSLFARPHPPYDNLRHSLDVEDIGWEDARDLGFAV